VSEGRQTEAGQRHAHPRGKVVRLPRDWLGPRDQLVPFGPRASSRTAEEPAADEPPPSAEDFWGERSAAIHSALQGPAVPAHGNDGSLGAQSIHRRRVDRRAVASAATGLAIAVLTVVALIASSLGGDAPPRPVSEAKAGFAAVFSGGVSSILRLNLGWIDTARLGAATAWRANHHPSARKPDHKNARPRVTPAVRFSSRIVIVSPPATAAGSRSYHRTSTGATNVTSSNAHVDTEPATRSDSPSRVSRPVSSGATISPTGESGALGPVQSPNG
jgi:hypothetical protein